MNKDEPKKGSSRKQKQNLGRPGPTALKPLPVLIFQLLQEFFNSLKGFWGSLESLKSYVYEQHSSRNRWRPG